MFIMVSLKIEVRKKDVTWVVLLVAVLIVGVVYAYGTSNPAVMGHSLGEIEGLGNLATKDSISWSEISGIPSGFADNVDNEGSGWPAGSYCIMANGACPSGFSQYSLGLYVGSHAHDMCAVGNRVAGSSSCSGGLPMARLTIVACCK